MSHLKNDIALLELESPVTLSDKVNTICLPMQDSRITDGHKCYITGNVSFNTKLKSQNTIQVANLQKRKP